MKPQTQAYLDKSREMLDDAKRALAADLAGHAARMAYFFAFHAAQALIIERLEKAVNTHKGGHALFARIARHELLGRELPAFVSSAYHYKEMIDYDTGPERTVLASDAARTIAETDESLATITGLLDDAA